jgi:hypothetical protein
VLRASSRRVDRLIQSELARQGGGVATIFNDQFELCGSRRVYRPALAEIVRFPKRYTCRPSDRWREMRTMLLRCVPHLELAVRKA